MNIIKINHNIFRYESFWRPVEDNLIFDFNDAELPYPEQSSTIWQNKKIFLKKLNDVSQISNRRSTFIPYERDDFKDCLLCKKKNITTGLHQIKNIRWENGLNHYVNIHNIVPSEEFIDFVFNYETTELNKRSITVGRINATIEINQNKKYLKVHRNQILIMDALMKHGSYRSYIENSKKTIYRFSEHAGMLDFNDTGLERFIIKGNTNRIPKGDNTIYLPNEFTEKDLDYEYIFHTHPPTHGLGGRIDDGVLYEFPSVGDVLHFSRVYNSFLIDDITSIPTVQGSIIVAPEGMYIIRKKEFDNKEIDLGMSFMREYSNKLFNIEQLAIDLYGPTPEDITEKMFYEEISQDREYIDLLNKYLNKNGLHIDYYARIKDDHGHWIIDTLYLPVYVVENVILI
jgi:hypothetical protein